jgi:cation diffusion facilitator CzcD-associated flavoprotein CzcO
VPGTASPPHGTVRPEQVEEDRGAVAAPDVDLAVVGAGVSGLYALHRARSLGLTVRVVEAGDDVGGTWYWNRYPGARFDSESHSYAYSFSPELLEAWNWSELFAGQPETLAYLRHVAERFDLRRDITFGTRVASATWDEPGRRWILGLDDGSQVTARFVVAGVGVLSAPTLPDLEGRDTFAGPWFHTADWPTEPLDLTGRRVGVVGTGATGVQVIQEVAKVAGHLTVFQRRPNWCAPLRNRPLTEDEQPALKATYPAVFDRCRDTYGCFVHDADRRRALEVSPEERRELWDRLYDEPGFGIWMGNFRDVLVDPEANALLSEYVADRIRGRVHDPDIAERLIPTDHGFGTRRVPLETGYYEVYNRPNVELVDLTETPIDRIEPAGVHTADGELHGLDVLVYATGFDAVVGSFDRIDILGVGGLALRVAWDPSPRALLGLMTAGFPNLFMTVGPHGPAPFCNMTRAIEHNVDWITALLEAMTAEGQTRVEPDPEAEADWTAEVLDAAQRLLSTSVDSWFTGVNANTPQRGDRRVLIYTGGFPRYRDRCREVAEAGYRGFRRS